MKFKKLNEDEEVGYSDDVYYDLFDGGYLSPHRFLDSQEDIEKVENAISIIRQYLDGMVDNGLIELG